LTAILMLLDPQQGATQGVRVELRSFQSVTLSDQEFLSGRGPGMAVTLAGVLRLPGADTGALPAVILLHGSSGITGMEDGWIRLLNDMGVATFMVDSFTGRGITSTVNDQAQLGRLAMVIDAYRALELLGQYRGIDPAKIAVMGFSRGGQAALYSSMRRFQRMYLKSSVAPFAAHVAFYSPCNTRYLDDDDVAHSPIRLFQGDADDFVAVAPCQAYVERIRKSNGDAALTVYTGARHIFDNPGLNSPLRIPGAQVTRRCDLEEGPAGSIIDATTHRQFSYEDSCVDRGVTVAYEAAASTRARLAVRALLTGAFGLSSGVALSAKSP
jgi:dienelactone hydrolase